MNKQPKKQCAAVEHGERCPLDVHAGQYCNKHYRRLQLNGTLEARPMGSIQTCQADENGVICGRPAKHKGLGLCTKHYGRYVRHGATELNTTSRPTTCQEEIEPGVLCGKPVKAQGRCHAHLMQFYRARQRREQQGNWTTEHSENTMDHNTARLQAMYWRNKYEEAQAELEAIKNRLAFTTNMLENDPLGCVKTVKAVLRGELPPL